MALEVAVIDYGAGNVQSVLFALARIGLAENAYALTADPAAIQAARRVIFPGQGEASTTMRNLHERGLAQLIPTLKQPVLGICIGLQLLCAHSEEGGGVDCLGVFGEQVRKFPAEANGQKLKIPQMGWNKLDTATGPLLDGLAGQYAYFVHSYYVELGAHTNCTATYGIPFAAGAWKDNFHAVQFHPEKSSALGETLLKRFLAL